MPHKESKSWFSFLFEKSADGQAVVELSSGKILEANDKISHILGVGKKELSESGFEAMGLDEDKLKYEGYYESVAFKSKDGKKSYFNFRNQHFDWEGASYAYLVFRDTTDRHFLERELLTKHSALKKAYIELETLQEKLVQAGKLSALGRLATGIAHELNQPLLVVRGFAEELDQSLKTEDGVQSDSKSYLNEIVMGCDRMNRIIQQLRSFAVKKSGDFHFAKVEDTIQSVLNFLQVQLRSHNIQVEYKKPNSVEPIWTDPFQLEQVLINLISNARDAIQGGDGSAGKIQIQIKQNKSKTEISVEDNGSGMSEDQLKNIFDPFFTTKEVGQGMGLGLSICFGIIEKLGGSIDVKSKQGKGTKFLISLPTAHEKQQDKVA